MSKVFLSALYFVAALVVSTSGICVRSVECPCGTSGNNYTFCGDGIVIRGEPCDRWLRCETCREGYPYCVTCPEGHFGGLCTTVSVRKPKRRKRQNSNTLGRRYQNPSSQSGNDFVCSHPGVDENGELKDFQLDERGGAFAVGTSLRYTCKTGYRLYGDQKIFCLNNGAWSANHPKCEPIEPISPGIDDSEAECVPLDSVVPHGRMNHLPLSRLTNQNSAVGGNPIGTEITYSCDEGYELVGSKRLVCNTQGFWSDLAPNCVIAQTEEISCVHPEILDNGKVFRFVGNKRPQEVLEDSTESINPVGTQLQFECNPGYYLQGEVSSICELSGSWSSNPPECLKGTPLEEPIVCVPIEPLLNGKVHRSRGANIEPELLTEESYDEDFPVGTLLVYSCDLGYLLQGHKDSFCETKGSWSHRAPECVLDCGISMMVPHTKVTNGNRTSAGEWPWVVSISEVANNNATVVICGGALLDRRTILTAAHCFNRNRPYYVLHFGKYYRRNNNKTGVESRTVQTRYQVIIHPQFNRITFANDIALVKLDSNLQYTERILPICLPTAISSTENLVEGKKGKITGWGVDENALRADVLMMADLPIQNKRTCMAAFQKQGLSIRMGPDMFCAGKPEGLVSACRGDSGSPFAVLNTITNRYTVEGCVSFGVEGQCGLAGRYTVFTRVTNFLDWITENRRGRP